MIVYEIDLFNRFKMPDGLMVCFYTVYCLKLTYHIKKIYIYDY